MKQLKYQLATYPLRFSFLLHIFFFAITYINVKPYFMSNDDIAMMLSVSGKILTTEPSPHVQFMHIFIGEVLSLLYTYFPDGHWYEGFFVSCLFIAYWQVCYVMLKRQSKITVLFLYILFFITSASYTLIALQFTIIASVLAFSGLIILFFTPVAHTHLSIKDIFLKPQSYQIIAFVMLLLAYMVRFESFIFILLVACPVIAYELYLKSQRIKTINNIAVLVVVLLICFPLQKYHLYRYKQWGNFLVFNEKRALFLDYSILEYAPLDAKIKALKAANWSVNDYVMLMTWFFSDEKVYNINNFDKALQALPKYKQEITFKQLWDYQKNVYSYALVLQSIGFLLFTLCFCKKVDILVITTSFIYLFFILLAIHYFLKPPPERVFIPAFYFISLLPLLFTHFTWQNLLKDSASIFTKIAFAITCLLVCISVFSSLKATKNSLRAEEKEEILKNLINIIQPNANKLFVVWGATFPYEYIIPFSNMDYLSNLYLMGLGTSQQTPDAKKLLKKFDVKDIYIDLAMKENLFFIASEKLIIENYFQYMKEHYSLNLRGEGVVKINNAWFVIKIRPVK
jgi:hypothetical protein